MDPANAGKFAEVLACKSTAWMTEQEWRILTDELGLKLLVFPVRRVITGINTSDQFKNKVCNAIVRAGRKGRIIRFAQRLPTDGPTREIKIH